jgi:hypothetical protein
VMKRRQLLKNRAVDGAALTVPRNLIERSAYAFDQSPGVPLWPLVVLGPQDQRAGRGSTPPEGARDCAASAAPTPPRAIPSRAVSSTSTPTTRNTTARGSPAEEWGNSERAGALLFLPGRAARAARAPARPRPGILSLSRVRGSAHDGLAASGRARRSGRGVEKLERSLRDLGFAPGGEARLIRVSAATSRVAARPVSSPARVALNAGGPVLLDIVLARELQRILSEIEGSRKAGRLPKLSDAEIGWAAREIWASQLGLKWPRSLSRSEFKVFARRFFAEHAGPKRKLPPKVAREFMAAAESGLVEFNIGMVKALRREIARERRQAGRVAAEVHTRSHKLPAAALQRAIKAAAVTWFEGRYRRPPTVEERELAVGHMGRLARALDLRKKPSNHAVRRSLERRP